MTGENVTKSGAAEPSKAVAARAVDDQLIDEIREPGPGGRSAADR